MNFYFFKNANHTLTSKTHTQKNGFTLCENNLISVKRSFFFLRREERERERERKKLSVVFG